MKLLTSPWTRAIVTVVLLAIVAHNIDWGTIGHRILSGQPAWFVAAILCVVAALLFGALRWHSLLHLNQIDLSVRELFRVYSVSTFTQSFLPTSVGGDVARSFLVVRRGPLLARVGSTVVVDRTGGLVGLLVVAWAGVVIGATREPHGAITGLVSATIVGAIVAVILGIVTYRRPAIAARLIPRRARATIRTIWEVVTTTMRDRRTLVIVLFTSIAFQALISLQIWALARCLGDSISFPAAAVTWTLVTFATLVPLSIGGFGIREGTFVLLLGSVGVSATDATLISLGTVVVLLIASVPGALMLATHGMRPALEPDP